MISFTYNSFSYNHLSCKRVSSALSHPNNVTEPRIRRETLANGLRLVTEAMPHVRSVSIGVWLTRGSRHEPRRARRHRPLRRAHALQGHDQPLGRGHRAAGGLDRRPARRLHLEGIRRLLHQGARRAPAARDRHPVRSRLATRPSRPRTSSARRRSSSKRSRWSRTRPTISCTSSSRRRSGTAIRWDARFSGRRRASRRSTSRRCGAISATPTWRSNFVVVAVGNLEHERLRALVEHAFAAMPVDGQRRSPIGRRSMTPDVQVRHKELEQSHVCLGTLALPQNHPDRYAAYALNTVLGGSMSSRLFQNVREKRGLAYAVFSATERLSGRRRASASTPGCAQRSGERADRRRRRRDPAAASDEPMPADELRRAKDHLKGSLMLNLESTSSRMSHLARQEIYRDRARHARRDARRHRTRHDRGRAAAGGAVFRRRARSA